MAIAAVGFTAFLTVWISVFSSLPHAATSVRHFNFYQRYFIEDVCSSNQSIIYLLDSNGLYSAAKIRASRYQLVRNNLNCSITVRPPYYHGVILTVDAMTFGYPSTVHECSDYIQVFSESGNSTKVCGHSVPGSFVSRGEMTFVYHTSDRSAYLQEAGFTIIATAFSRGLTNCGEDRFKCRSNRCIWENFACDGIRNCEDDSDEEFGGLSKCREIADFTARPMNGPHLTHPTLSVYTEQNRMTTMTTSIFCLLFVLMSVLLRVYCYRWNQRHDRIIERQLTQLGNDIVSRRSSNFDIRPPSYSTLQMILNEPPRASPSENPPPYSVAVPEEDEDDKPAPVSDDQKGNSTSKEQFPLIPSKEPPPPYTPSNNV